MLAVPGVGGRQPQRPPRLALMARVADVVVGLVGLAHARKRVRGRAVVRSEAAHVHAPEVERGLAGVDPLGRHLADPAGSREPVCAEPGGHEQAAHLGLAEAELVVGRERLRPVDHPRHAHVLHLRHAPARARDDLLEAVPVVLEQPPVEVGRDAFEAGRAVEEGRARLSFVAPHHEPAAVLAEVDEQVGIAQRRERPCRVPVAEGLGDDVLVRHRDDRDAHARQPAELGGEHAARDHDGLGLDVAALGAYASDAAGVRLDAGHARARVDARSARAGALGKREGELRRVEVAVAREPGGAADFVQRHQREELARLFRGDQLERQAERLRPARLAAQLLHALLARGQPDAPALDPAAVLAELAVELDGVHHHARQRHGAAQLSDQAGRVEGRARGELVALDEHDVVPAELG